MSEITLLLVYAALATAAIPAGAAMAHVARLKREPLRQGLLHGIVAFGGGILLSAVAFVLLPQGIPDTTLVERILAFFGGGAIFLLVDRAIEIRGEHAAQLMAIIADGVPESIALGAMFAVGAGVGPLFALLVGLQNLPEGFNAYRELRTGGITGSRILASFSPLALLGPLGAALGFVVLAPFPRVVSWLLLFAAGGIVYIVFHDVAPLAHQRRHWVPTLGAVAGFLVGMVSEALLVPA